MAHVDVSALAFDHDPADPDGFRAGMARLGPRLGAERSGVTVGLYTGERDEDLIAERASGVDYYHGEA